MPPCFLPLEGASHGLFSSVVAGPAAGFNLSSNVGGLCAFLSDEIGPEHTLLISLVLTAGKYVDIVGLIPRLEG